MNQTHSLADTQAFIIERNSLGIVTQTRIAFENEGINTEHAKQVAYCQTCWACANDNDGEIWKRWCVHVQCPGQPPCCEWSILRVSSIVGAILCGCPGGSAAIRNFSMSWLTVPAGEYIKKRSAPDTT